jgi:2-polyprenyl-3-methyl-5-hydroxy-6-metoxy-1,4-benzoquinol methylase
VKKAEAMQDDHAQLSAQGRMFTYSSTELESLVEARNYYRWIVERFTPYLGDTVIEVGAGIGNFSDYLVKTNNLARLFLVEPSQNLFPHLKDRFSDRANVMVLQGCFEEVATEIPRVNSIVLVNVLEHMENDDEFLEVAYNRLLPGGALLLLVPALPWLHGTLDEAFGHYRRYTKSSLNAKLERQGFRQVSTHYINLVGVAAWYLTGTILRRKTLRSQDVKFYDTRILPWILALEKYWEPPIGQNLIAIWRK